MIIIMIILIMMMMMDRYSISPDAKGVVGGAIASGRCSGNGNGTGNGDGTGNGNGDGTGNGNSGDDHATRIPIWTLTVTLTTKQCACRW